MLDGRWLFGEGEGEGELLLLAHILLTCDELA